MAALQRAVACRDDDDRARGIREALRLDVPRLVEVLLHEALAATEGGDRLARRRLEELGDLVELARDLEAASAAAVCRLDGDRQADLFRERDDLVGAGDGAGRSRGERGADLLGDRAGGDLVAEGLDRLGRGADPDEARGDHRAGEVGVLGEEPVAGVYGVGAGATRDGENLLDREVRLGARRPFQGISLVGELRVHGVAILVGVDGDRALSGVAGGADHAHGDLAAIGDEDLGDRSLGVHVGGGRARPGFDGLGRRHGKRHGCQPTQHTPPSFGSLAQDPCENVVRTYEATGAVHRSVHRMPSSPHRCRSVDRDIPTTVEGSPSTRSMKAPPRLSTVNAPATCRGSPVPT